MASTTSIEDYKQIARQIPEDVATEKKLDLIDDLQAENAVENDTFTVHRGREAIRDHLEGTFTSFPDLTATVEQIIGEGDTVAMRVTLRGTHEGKFMGIEPTGREFEVQNMVFTRVDDEKIIERRIQPDVFGMLQQLGVTDQEVG